MRAPVVISFLSAVLLLGQEPVDPWPSKAVWEPAAVAQLLSTKDQSRPAMFYVGFPNLYSGAHVQGATLNGPGSKSAGLDELRRATEKLARSQPVVIYCGCCPFDKCPNIRPAYRQLKEQGFTDIRVMKIPTNLHTDWVTKGYPTVKGTSPQ